MNKKLIPATIKTGRSTSVKRKANDRNGFKDESKQVYAPPKSAKRVEAWKKAMRDKGFSFAD